jgi:hypothetical protein
MGKCKSRVKSKTSNNSENSDNTGMIIIIVFAVCVCCIFSSVISSIVAYFLLQEEELPFDKSVFEYRTKKDGQKIISPSQLPMEIKDAYYLNLPAGNKNYKFIGKKCYNGVCDTLELKNTPAMHLYYDDGNVMSGKLSYNT